MDKKYTWDSNLKIRLIGETIFNVFYWMYFPFIAIYFSQSIGLAWTDTLVTIPPIISLLAGMIGGSLADKLRTYGSRSCKPGPIKQSTIIGKVGSSGSSTGPHLHIELHSPKREGPDGDYNALNPPPIPAN